MTPAQLLRELEPLTHCARVRRMVEVGRLARGDASAAATLAALEQGGFYERWLSLQACHGSRDAARVLRALTDPSRAIRGRARRLVPVVCDDAQAESALERVSSLPERRRLVARLFASRRRAPIDSLLDRLAAQEDPELGRLLQYGSPEIAARHLDTALARGAPLNWAGLARHHPDLVADALQRQVDAAERPDPRLTSQVNAALPSLADKSPDRALSLVRALLRHAPLSALSLEPLVTRRPADVADLLLNSRDWPALDLDKLLPRLDVERLVRLCELQRLRARTGAALGVVLRDPERLFGRLSPDVRVSLHAACADLWRDADGALAGWLVEMLPTGPRQAEATRHVNLPSLATKPAVRLQYAAFLPWEELIAAISPYLTSSDVELRGIAVTSLVSAGRYHRDRLPEILAILRARRNEQDPVRLAILRALACQPPGIWRSEHLDDLGLIIRMALDAPDLSDASAGWALELLVKLVPAHPAWSARWLAVLADERGTLHTWDLGGRLNSRDVREIADALTPILQAWLDRGREFRVVSLARSLGRRLLAFDALVALLEHLLRDATDAQTAQLALDTLASLRGYPFARLAPRLLQQDRSWVTRPAVYEYLHHRRQDLLTPFIRPTRLRGRFPTVRDGFLLPFTSGFQRWTVRQQTTFADALAARAAEPGRDTPTVLAAIRQLSALPAVRPTALGALAQPDAPRAAVRDAALAALGRLDRDEGSTILLAGLHDDRARVAIYALRRTLLQMPGERALELLRQASMERVTVAKEVVRLLGELRSEAAFRELLSLDGRELHRDVRAALLRALWSYLDRDEAWEALDRAAESSDANLASVVVRTPVDDLPPERQLRMTALLAKLLEHPNPEVRFEVLLRCAQSTMTRTALVPWAGRQTRSAGGRSRLPTSDPERVLFLRLLELIASRSRDEARAAVAALFGLADGHDAPFIAQTARRLLPDRQGLRILLDGLHQTLRSDFARFGPLARAVMAVLEDDPVCLNQRVRLALAVYSAEELIALVDSLVASGQLDAELTMQVAGGLRPRADTHGSNAEYLEQLERRWTASDDERLRRLALAALVAQSGAGPGSRWSEAQRSRLEAFGRDPSRTVAAAAQFTFPPDPE